MILNLNQILPNVSKSVKSNRMFTNIQNQTKFCKLFEIITHIQKHNQDHVKSLKSCHIFFLEIMQIIKLMLNHSKSYYILKILQYQ